jgi:hypothetical protein
MKKIILPWNQDNCSVHWTIKMVNILLKSTMFLLLCYKKKKKSILVFFFVITHKKVFEFVNKIPATQNKIPEFLLPRTNFHPKIKVRWCMMSRPRILVTGIWKLFSLDDKWPCQQKGELSLGVFFIYVILNSVLDFNIVVF